MLDAVEASKRIKRALHGVAQSLDHQIAGNNFHAVSFVNFQNRIAHPQIDFIPEIVDQHHALEARRRAPHRKHSHPAPQVANARLRVGRTVGHARPARC